MKPNPWARRQARRALVQALYQWQITHADTRAIELEFEDAGTLKKADLDFFTSIFRALTLTAPVDDHFAPLLDRAVKDLDQVELALLRLGTYELVHRADVPFRVVIDEYVELAKTFGAEDSHKYVNGVLDKLARQVRAAETAAR